MATKLSNINGKVLVWARETAGYSISEAASVLSKSVSAVEAWEQGRDAPTYVQLETLAYKLYKRPLAIFFFPEIPDEAGPKKLFRTLPQPELEQLTPDTRLALREAQARRLALHDLTGGVNASRNQIVRELKSTASADPMDAAQKARAYIGVTLDEQASWHGQRAALHEWRDRVQRCGVFVFKRPMKQRDISGFSILDAVFPLIYLNNSTPLTRQAFSLFHELAHILLGENGVTKQNDDYIAQLSERYRRIERFCNAFAAEVLVPSADFSRFENKDFHKEEEVESIACRYHVSREVVLRRALDRHLVEPAYYEMKSEEWARQARKAGRGGGGGSYYLNQAAYLGTRFLKLAFGRWYEGKCSREQLAEYLGVKAKSLDGLEPLAMAVADK